jgi:hypothetical protein
MASKTYTQPTATGNITMVRSTKQGAPEKPDDFKNSCTVSIHMTQQDYNQFIEAQRKSNMNKSAFGRLALGLGIDLFESNNC